MATLVTDPDLSATLIQDRQACGMDHHDEVWEGVYVMSPIANDEHQQLVTRLSTVLTETIDFSGLGEVRAGVNLTSLPEDWKHKDWKHNFRVPDVVVFLKDSGAVCHGAYWSGGPDLAVEIVSSGDQTREKIAFYEKVETRELLIIDRDPWQLELHRFLDKKLVLAGTSSLADPAWLVSETVPLKLRLLPGEKRPLIELSHSSSDQIWQI